ncbi:hypothetical protein JCM10908_004722 [Rhodotorula pacifica]|uniref:Fat3p n=1 Tax=Rhodotorula pacifica TaxID=1495444 RepID=UPI00317D6DB3
MQAVELARRAIERQETAPLERVRIDGDDGETTVETLARWLDHLQTPEHPEEDLLVVLRAIRVCRFQSSVAEQIVTSVAPLLLPAQTLPIGSQAAGCALQYISTCSADARQRIAPALLLNLSKALGPVLYQLPTGSQRLYRFVSTCQRILALLVSKPLLNNEDTCQVLVGVVATWMFAGSQAGSGLASPAPSRSRVPLSGTPAASQLSFGVMSAFAHTSPQKRAPRPRQNSNASLASTSRSVSRSESRISDSESDTESDAGVPRNRQRDAAQLRLDALGVLRTIAATDARALHKHWHLFLADSPFLRTRPTLSSLIESDPSRTVRIQAALTLKTMLEGSEAFLAIAEDRTTKAAFTSLSAKVGETVAEMHLSLSACLARTPAAGQVDVHLAQLDLARTLGQVSPYGRILRPLAWTLAKAILPLLSQEDSRLIQAAVAALCAIIRRHRSTASKAMFDWRATESAATALLNGEQAGKAKHAWQLLSAIAEPQSTLEWLPVLEKAIASFESAPSETQLAQVSLASALIRSGDERSRSGSLAVVSRALQSPHSYVVAAACAVLPDVAGSDVSFIDPWRTAVDLASSANVSEVRQAAVRAIGVMAKAQFGVRSASQHEHDAIRALLEYFNGAHASNSGMTDMDAGETVWALANLCDRFWLNAPPPDLLEAVLECALILLATNSADEQVTTSSLRILASAYKTPLNVRLLHEKSVLTAQLLCDNLAHPAAKVRWNACISSAAILGTTHAHEASSAFLRPLFDALIAIIAQDPSFKVRIHAVNALALLPRTDSSYSKITTTGCAALEGLTAQLAAGDVPKRERLHAEMLVKRLQALLTPPLE